jgi:hypothetical protein
MGPAPIVAQGRIMTAMQWPLAARAGYQNILSGGKGYVASWQGLSWVVKLRDSSYRPWSGSHDLGINLRLRAVTEL